MIFLAVSLAAIFATSKDLVSKKLAASVEVGVSAFASFLFALPFYFVLMFILWSIGQESFLLSWGFVALVVARSITDVIAEYCKMQALQHGDLSLVSPLLSLSPVFILLVSPIITGDPMTKTGAISVLLVVAGTLVLLYKPGARHQVDKRAYFYSFATSIFFALNNCFDRLAVQKSTPVFSGFAMTLLAAIFLWPMIWKNKPGQAQLKQYFSAFTLRGLFEVLYMVAKLYALQTMQAPYVAALLRVSLLFSIIGGRIMFDEKDFFKRLCAGVLILMGVCTVFLE